MIFSILIVLMASLEIVDSMIQKIKADVSSRSVNDLSDYNVAINSYSLFNKINTDLEFANKLIKSVKAINKKIRFIFKVNLSATRKPKYSMVRRGG